MKAEELKKDLLHSPAAEHWKRIGVKKRAGLLFPLFSLNTKNNMGIGEFPDLKLLIDWCVLTGHSIIQLLPLNDTGPANHPYSALSAFALNPMFLSPLEMDGLAHTEKIRTLIPQPRKNNRKRRFDYRSIFRLKREIFHEIFDHFETKGNQSLHNDFEEFLDENSEWLIDYSLYMALKERLKWKSWEKWKAPFKNRDEGELERFEKSNEKSIRFYSFLQWQAHKQFTRVHDYAKEKGILIKGDIPFLVGRDSADVWAFGENFNLDKSAGAPPDMFSETGQKWGFPTFNWETMKDTNYIWYRRRLRQAEKYYDIYRIDHAVGIYRIYTINKKSLDGRIGTFVPEDESEWKSHGENLIKMMLDSSHMLPVAEDLGVVPDCVRPNLKKLGVPRTIVDRWEKNYHGDGNFIDLKSAEPVAMNTLSTHDTETLRQWWRDNPEERYHFYRCMDGEGNAPDILTSEIHHKILERSLSSSCLFTINLPQDIFSLGTFFSKPDMHRINVPSTVSKKNWSYRFPIMMEDLLSPQTKEIEEENRRITKLIHKSGRG